MENEFEVNAKSLRQGTIRALDLVVKYTELGLTKKLGMSRKALNAKLNGKSLWKLTELYTLERLSKNNQWVSVQNSLPSSAGNFELKITTFRRPRKIEAFFDGESFDIVDFSGTAILGWKKISYSSVLDKPKTLLQEVIFHLITKEQISPQEVAAQGIMSLSTYVNRLNKRGFNIKAKGVRMKNNFGREYETTLFSISDKESASKLYSKMQKTDENGD